MQLESFVPGSVAANQFHAGTRTIQGFRQQFHQCLIRRGIHRRGGHFDAQFIAQRLANLAGRRPGLKLDRQQSSVRVRTEKIGQGHGTRGELFVFRIDELESQRRQRRPGQIAGEVDPQIGGLFDMH